MSPWRTRWSPRRVAGVMGAVAASTWFVHLAVSYALVPTACRRSTTLPLLVVTLAGAGIGVATVAVIVRSGDDDRQGSRAGRIRAMLHGSEQATAARVASSGLAIAAYFTFVMLLAALVPILVAPCA